MDSNSAPPDSIQYAIDLAKRAVTFDKEGEKEGAAYFYDLAAACLERLLKVMPDMPQSWHQKALEYRERAEALRSSAVTVNPNHSSLKSTEKCNLDRANFLIMQALDADEKGSSKEAIEFYIQAVELCTSSLKKSSDPSVQEKLRKVAHEALDRAETLKGLSDGKKNLDSKAMSSNHTPDVTVGARLGRLDIKDKNRSGLGAAEPPTSVPLKVSGLQSYTEEEKRVLAMTSLINGREYVPFMKGDLQEKFAFPLPFSDKHGKLSLSPKQAKLFSSWSRPEEFMSEPKIIHSIDCFTIKQTIVSDCSFVASLAVAAQFEKRFRKRLITNIIYPQNRNGEPMYNPCGKYMIKLRINGVARKVIVDDFLPLGRHTELLCSYSANKTELWVSLLEKAYMKVMGGYDFPGSNSNIDLHALTGWVPERVSLKSSPELDKDALFKKLYDRFHKGDVLVTMATGEMSDAEADRTGLVSAHAYAMLDIREVKGLKLFMLKNPWSHVRWRGRFSELDTKNWTEDLRKQLNFDPQSAAAFDNGVFWIDYESLCRFFDVAYLNWNPALFSYTFCTHQMWTSTTGPVRDLYNIGENPQYSLEVRSPGSSAVWILLTRHITEIEDFRENREYIAVLVYTNDGKRVHYPFDPKPYIDGVRINSPHYLCKIVQSGEGIRRYTLVVSQYEKLNNIYYTLRVYSTCPFELKKIPNPYKYKEEEKNGSWKGVTAGGCANHRDTYRNNPRYQLTVKNSNSQLLIELKGPKEYQIGFDVTCTGLLNDQETCPFSRKSSGPFRSGFVIMELDGVPAGQYQIVPSTYEPRQEGRFFLTVKSTSPATLQRCN